MAVPVVLCIRMSRQGLGELECSLQSTPEHEPHCYTSPHAQVPFTLRKGAFFWPSFTPIGLHLPREAVFFHFV